MEEPSLPQESPLQRAQAATQLEPSAPVCRHSQLNLALLKLLQDRLPLAGPAAGGELRRRHASESLD